MTKPRSFAPVTDITMFPPRFATESIRAKLDVREEDRTRAIVGRHF